MDKEFTDEPQAAPELAFGPGDKLRQAREAKGLSLEQVASDTRIPQRNLELIEVGAFDELPGRTYAFGFSRTYAKHVGLDETEIVGEVREQLARTSDRQPARAATYEPGDPARVPSGGLVWLSLAAVVLLLAGGFAFYRSFFSPAVDLPPQMAEQEVAPANQPSTAAASAPANAPASGPVVFTAVEDGIWVKFYDANGDQLMQKQMAKGESYTVPADAEGPQLWTGRPDALTITVGGKAVPKLAEEDRIMKDVPVTAAALTARQGASAPEPSAPAATSTVAQDAG